MESKTTAIIVAAGRGERFSSAIPKQFIPFRGKSLLIWTVEVFKNHPAIDQIIIVYHADDKMRLLPLLEAYDFDIKCVEGGGTRQESVYKALASLLDDEPSRVIIHDGVRPFVSHELIDTGLKALTVELSGVVPGLPSTDTMKSAHKGIVLETLDRQVLWRIQTPQFFWFKALWEAHCQASQTSFTDDAAVVEAAGGQIGMIMGEEMNIKVTTPLDLQKWIPPDVRVAQGVDVHRLVPGKGMKLAGVYIPCDWSLEGHSDADLIFHALTDALLGTLADGDIGHHFSDKNPHWRGADSQQFLDFALQRLIERGGTITHVDVTVVGEVPKISTHRESLRQKIATVLALDLSRVSVKATTTEKMGFTGRQEGLMALATVTVIFL